MTTKKTLKKVVELGDNILKNIETHATNLINEGNYLKREHVYYKKEFEKIKKLLEGEKL